MASGASLSGIVLADLVLKRQFLRAGLAFPSSLAGMMALFTGARRPRIGNKSSRTKTDLFEGRSCDGDRREMGRDK